MDYQPHHYRRTPPPDEDPDFPVRFPERFEPEPVAEGVYWIRSLGNAGWVITPDGVVLIDSGYSIRPVFEALRRTTDLPIRRIVYTHGHEDHVITQAYYERFAPDAQAIAHALVPDRLRKYERLAPYISRINAVQFHRTAGSSRREYHYPDLTYHDEYHFELGGREFHLFHARGETDDGTVIHLPDAGVVFAGDLLIGAFPNLGNPYKVVRYGRDWHEALSRIRALEPNAVVPGHGTELLGSPELARQTLDDTIAALRFVDGEVVHRLNEGQTLDQMVREIRLSPDLEDRPALRQVYSRLELAVITTHRRYAGWFDWDPATVYPTPRTELADELRALIGDDRAVLDRARALAAEGQRQLALELIQILVRSDPAHRAARELRLSLLEQLRDDDRCLMTHGVWQHYAAEDREFLARGEPKY